MERKCTEGHDLEEGEDVCSEGHPLHPGGAIAKDTFTISNQSLNDIIKNAVAGALAAQNASREHPPPRTRVKKPNPVRPIIDLDSSEGDWDFFIAEWGRYKRQAEIKDSEVTDELQDACSKELRKDIFDFVGPSVVETLNEKTLLEHIKTLAIKGKNKAVHRKEFYGMSQAPGQPVQAFVGKLKSKAAHCNFTVKCTSNLCQHQTNSYAELMVSDQMVVGCNDPDIQEEVFAKDSQLGSFHDKFALIQAIEEGKTAKSQLVAETPASTVAVSQYQKKKKSEKLSQKPPIKCQGCGSSGHGRGTDMPRARHCPAWDKICDHCHIKGHFSSVCRNKVQQVSPQTDSSAHHTFQGNDVGNTSYFFAHDEPEDATFSQQLRQKNKSAWQQRSHPMERTTLYKRILVPHMEWNGDRFKATKPKSLPTLNGSVTLLHKAHHDFKKGIAMADLQTMNHHVAIKCLADTGAQTCASGPELLEVLNMHPKYLIPTSHRIVGVTQSFMDIMGVALVKIEADGKSTNQVVYISRNIKGFFLSESAHLKLGIIPPTFPSPNNFSETPSMAAGCEAKQPSNPSVASCGCPVRSGPPPPPTQLPFQPTPGNRERLEEWLLQYYASSAFNVCEHQLLPKMTGRPLDIHFKPDGQPKAFHCPIPVPHHWKKQVKADLDRDVRLGIVEPVPPGTPTIWCSKMVVVAKKDGSPRRTVDLQHLNAATYRETHHTPSPYNQASVVPPATKKTVLDAWNGYHSLALSSKASEATTFITEWGRYRYLSSPQGFHAAGDGYTKAFDDITMDFPRKAKCIDDTVMWDKDIEAAFWHTIDYLNKCASNGIVFNPKKFTFACDEVDFAGFTLTQTGMKPMQQIINAIKNFPTPTDITGARSWFGLINQVAYAFSMADEMSPYRDLLKTGRNWYWDETLDGLFAKSKGEIVKLVEKGVHAFEMGRPTCLATDWSKDGIGFILLQKFCTCTMEAAPNCCKQGWHLIYAGSRFTTEAESRYAPVEGEALAVVYALEKCRIFVLGCPNLLVAVDHKPLVKILGDRSLEDIKNPRLFNLKEKTLMYKYSIKHVPGAWHTGPDACSRYPAKMSSALQCFSVHAEARDIDAALHTNNFVEASVHAAMSGGGYTHGIEVQVITWDRVKEASAQDNEIVTLINTIITGFPDLKEELPDVIKPYWNVKDELSCIDGAALYQNRIIAPKILRQEILESLHSAHQGTVGMKARARASVFWPGINSAIESRRASCKTCTQIAPSQPAEPMIQSPHPEYPFDQVVADFFNLTGRMYLVYADRYTGWVVILQTPSGSTGSAGLKKHLRMLFSMYGAPRELSADGGPPFPSYDMQSFFKAWGVHYRQSSSYYAQSNGRAELAVKVAKRILLDNVGPGGDINNDRVARALLQHRNTPLQEIGLSPAQILYGRVLRDCIPTIEEAMKIRPEWRMLAENRERALARRNIVNMEHYNEHAKSLPPLIPGDIVAVQNQSGAHPKRWEKTGVVAETADHRQYTIRMDGSGRCTLRNRRFLKKILPVCSDRPMTSPRTQVVNTPLVQLHYDSPPSQPPHTSPLEPTLQLPTSPAAYDKQDPVPRRLQFPTPVHPVTPHVANDLVHQSPPQDLSKSASDAPPVAILDAAPQVPVRQSARVRRARRELSPRLQGKAHGYIDIGP